MKIESTGFTEEDLKAFLQETVAFERTRAKDDLTLADRLEAALARRLELHSRIVKHDVRFVHAGWATPTSP